MESNNIQSSLFADNEGNMWASTSEGGQIK